MKMLGLQRIVIVELYELHINVYLCMYRFVYDRVENTKD